MGASLGMTDSGSQEQNQFSEDVWGPQGEALKGLYGQASDLYGGSDGFQDQIRNSAGQSGGWLNDIMGGSQAGRDQQLGGGSFGDTSDVRDQLMNSMNQGGSQMGNMYNSIVGGEGNNYIDPMVDAMKSGAMENNAMMQSGNAQNAAAMGQGGGSRHAMQNAMTNSATNQQMLNQETNMRGGAYDKDLAMKMGIAGQADNNQQMNNDRMMQMLQGSDYNRQQGMQAGQGMNQMGQSGVGNWQNAQNAQWNPMNQFANIIGGPQTLKSGSGSGSSNSSGFETSGGMK